VAGGAHSHAQLVAAYLPYLGVGSGVVGFLPGYVAEEGFASGSGFWLVDIARRAVPVGVEAYLGLAGCVLVGVTVGRCWGYDDVVVLIDRRIDHPGRVRNCGGTDGSQERTSFARFRSGSIAKRHRCAGFRSA
jgi:hypothetical protein